MKQTDEVPLCYGTGIFYNWEEKAWSEGGKLFFQKMEEIALEGVPKSQLEAGVRFRRWNGQLGVGWG